MVNTLNMWAPLGHQLPVPVLAERQRGEQHASGDMPLLGEWHISASLHDVHGSLWLQSRLGNVFCFLFQLRKSLPGIEIRVQLVGEREWILERQLSCVKIVLFLSVLHITFGLSNLFLIMELRKSCLYDQLGYMEIAAYSQGHSSGDTD